jgi:hypothetical protein
VTRGMAFIVFSAAIVFASGCAVSGAPYQSVAIPAGKSVVNVYRPYSLVGGGVKPTLTCGAEGVALGPGGYHSFIVDPGTITCHAKTEVSADLDIQAEAGQMTYVKEEIGAGVLVGHPHLYLMDTNSGEREIASCKQQN